MSGNTAVLLLAYGTPERPEDVEPYFTHIRGGRRPSPEAVEELKHRYALVGGRTPLLDVTRVLAGALEAQLASGDRVFVAMKHWHPFIADVVPRLAAEGIDRVIAIVMAPHYSRMSIGGYRRALEDANRRLGSPLDVQFVDHWHLHPAFIAMMADRVRDAVRAFPLSSEPVMTLFSAHSLPVRIREWGDPYEAQLIQTCAAVAHQAGLSEWRFAWQSAGHTGEPWLGPDIVEYLESLHGEGVRRVLSVPIGFLSEHLEVLYDIDHEARSRAEELGMVLRRIEMPNASPAMIDTLAALVNDVRRGALGEPLATAPGMVR
jgi:ferrochelatase